MRIFVTGASGHIGSALVPELLAGGHQVIGLARSAASAAALAGAGATPLRGDLDALDLLRDEARRADGVIHLAFKHDLAFSGPDGFLKAAHDDRRAAAAIGDALAGSNKAFVTTSGTALLAHAGHGRTSTEDDARAEGPRIDAENAVIALADRGVRSSVVRLPPTVHSALDRHGFIPMLIDAARTRGFAAFVGDGGNRWPAVHTLDAARVYRLAVERAPAGSRLHAVAEEGVPFRAIAEAIARGLRLPAQTVTVEDAASMGFVGRFVQLDNPTTSAHTRAVLEWQPSHASLLADLAEGHYYR